MILEAGIKATRLHLLVLPRPRPARFWCLAQGFVVAGGADAVIEHSPGVACGGVHAGDLRLGAALPQVAIRGCTLTARSASPAFGVSAPPIPTGTGGVTHVAPAGACAVERAKPAAPYG